MLSVLQYMHGLTALFCMSAKRQGVTISAVCYLALVTGTQDPPPQGVLTQTWHATAGSPGRPGPIVGE